MDAPRELRDREVLERLLRRDPWLHLYELGDLDDFYFPRTRWFACGDQLVLLYDAPGLPVVLALTRDPAALAPFLEQLSPRLPRPLYSHLSPGLAEALAAGGAQEPHGRYLKMGLTLPERARAADASDAFALTPDDLAEAEAFYRDSYIGNWFDPRMLATGRYYGLRTEGRMDAIAGVHVFSPILKVAALGNIAVRPSRRGQGLAQRVTARLVQQLMTEVDHIGLNVRADNAAAIGAYERLGFTPVAEYDEVLFR